MNVDRLLRDVEKRLVGLPEGHRAEVLDALREEIAKERRRLDPAATVESERERRLEAETLREVLEAINRHATLEETIAEVLKQLSRIVLFDSCSLALLESDGVFRIFSVRGFPEPSRVIGQTFKDELSESIRANRWPLALTDVSQDERFAKISGTEQVRSWAGLPLLMEGEVVGLLSLDRHRVESFSEEDLHRAKAVAFSAAAAIRKAQLHEHIRRYAALMERVVAVDHAVFGDASREKLEALILEGALRIGNHSGGLLILASGRSARIATAAGAFEPAAGKPAPKRLTEWDSRRLSREELKELAVELGLRLPEQEALFVPLATSDSYLGALLLLADGADSQLATLLESYASRAATAYAHVAPSRS